MCAVKNEKKYTKGGVVLPSVDRNLQMLGHDINLARRARRFSMEDMAQRMGCSRSTLHRLEKGDAGTSLNTLARALQVLGMLGKLSEIVDQPNDDIGLLLNRQTLPKRISRRRPKPVNSGAIQGPVFTDDDEPQGF